MSSQRRPLRTLLYGTEDSFLDDKGRFVLSAGKRAKLGDSICFVDDPRGCILLLPQDIAEEIAGFVTAGGFESNLFFNSKVRELARWFLGGLEDGRIDAQGRVVIPMRLRTRAEITKSVQVVGMGDYLELWSAEKRDAFENGQSQGQSPLDQITSAVRERNRILGEELVIPAAISEGGAE